MENLLDKEDFINHILNSSDYELGDIQDFIIDEFENLCSIEYNVDKFIKWYNENKEY